jgi:hypothetical protein
MATAILGVLNLQRCIVFKISNDTNLIFHFISYNAKNIILILKILFVGYKQNKIIGELIQDETGIPKDSTDVYVIY